MKKGALCGKDDLIKTILLSMVTKTKVYRIVSSKELESRTPSPTCQQNGRVECLLPKSNPRFHPKLSWSRKCILHLCQAVATCCPGPSAGSGGRAPLHPGSTRLGATRHLTSSALHTEGGPARVVPVHHLEPPGPGRAFLHWPLDPGRHQTPKWEKLRTKRHLWPASLITG